MPSYTILQMHPILFQSQYLKQLFVTDQTYINMIRLKRNSNNVYCKLDTFAMVEILETLT